MCPYCTAVAVPKVKATPKTNIRAPTKTWFTPQLPAPMACPTQTMCPHRGFRVETQRDTPNVPNTQQLQAAPQVVVEDFVDSGNEPQPKPCRRSGWGRRQTKRRPVRAASPWISGRLRP